MAGKVPDGWYDISVPVKQGMNYYPTDDPPKIYRCLDRDLGGRVNVSMMEIVSHTGTHIDAPLHFIPGGASISDMPLDAAIGPCRVIEIKDPEKITAGELERHDIKKGERVLFKTRNSPRVYSSEKFVEDYVYLDADGASCLVSKGITLFGLDSLSIGYFKNSENLRLTHETLLGAGIYILEDCALDGVPPGEYDLLCLPLLMWHGDGAPCRAILRPLK